ncbi:hypothetical protein RFI_34174 [Reticulomyxa filosa]|uniref:Uncharacterized protein n=1 Tax=Reticulomyxa filosa TaxID=46433 RepID=X6LPD0_RETFI|nr:hypothetical protein RFI_34174 [Reticulomyxa filosa]|eukprot:ETO03236.1 hypothetical protein RFI_34174 [Reticulomyxa filosa]
MNGLLLLLDGFNEIANEIQKNTNLQLLLQQVFKRQIWKCTDLLCVISVKSNEQQLDDVIEFFMDVFIDKDIHYRCAFSIAKIALNLNERQLNKMFEFLMKPLRVERLQFVMGVYTYLQRFYHNWEEQSDNVFQCFVHKFSSYFCNRNDGADATQFIMELKEE